jgi:hypothetical protein
MNNFDLIDDEIISIEEYDEIDTIDISVEDTHMFFANDIYTHNSGFDAELVEAHQSGGNIKRVQKAHFFMSVAKTPDQKEAHLANIRIIKARFVQDGQTFKDCIFNNDTMQIIIRDDRYIGNRYKGIKKYGDEELDKFNKKVGSIELHSRISEALPSPEQQNHLDSLKEAYLKQIGNKNEIIELNVNLKQDEIKTIVDIADNSINESKNDSLFELEGNVEIVPAISIDSLNDTISTENKQFGIETEAEINKKLNEEIYSQLNPINSIFEWTGETYNENTIIEEVEIDDIEKVETEPPIIIDNKSVEYNKIDKQENVFISPKVFYKDHDDSDKIIYSIDEVEKMLMIDPDESMDDNKHIFEILEKAHKSQDVIKKE